MFFMQLGLAAAAGEQDAQRFGVEQRVSCVAQVEKCIVDGQRGRFLPENFKFADKHEASFASDLLRLALRSANGRSPTRA